MYVYMYIHTYINLFPSLLANELCYPKINWVFKVCFLARPVRFIYTSRKPMQQAEVMQNGVTTAKEATNCTLIQQE
jgi:hypothetical protein